MRVTFSRANPGTPDDATRQYTGASVSVVSGDAGEIRGSLDRYAALSLTLASTVTLLFEPDTYGLRSHTPEFVQPGDTVVWNGATAVVKDVDPVGFDGVVIVSHIIVST